jgi:hypothetical protein
MDEWAFQLPSSFPECGQPWRAVILHIYGERTFNFWEGNPGFQTLPEPVTSCTFQQVTALAGRGLNELL